MKTLFALVLKGGYWRHLGCARKNSVNAEVNGVVECWRWPVVHRGEPGGNLKTISFIFLQYPFYLIVLWQMSIFSLLKAMETIFKGSNVGILWNKCKVLGKTEKGRKMSCFHRLSTIRRKWGGKSEEP